MVLGLAGGAAAVGGKVLLERVERPAARYVPQATRRAAIAGRAGEERPRCPRCPIAQRRRPDRHPAASRREGTCRAWKSLRRWRPASGAARQEADAATRRSGQSEEAYKAARRRWREALSAAGLPEQINVKQARRLVERGDWLAKTQLRLTERQEELARRRRELDSLTARIVQLATDAGVSLGSEEGPGFRVQGSGVENPKSEIRNPKSPDPIKLLGVLSEAAGRQKEAVARRNAIRREARRIRAVQAKRDEAIARLKHGRRQLFLEAGVDDEQEFRRRALECGRAEVLRRQREALSREIEAALAPHCSEDMIRQQLESQSAAALESRRGELVQRLAAVQQQLHALLDNRGRLSAQIDAIAGDRSLAAKQLDLAILEKRLDEAVHRWQVLATACSILDSIRDNYEQHRQPETLQEASGYLDRLTQGRYCRVWTPLGQHALRVDDAAGLALPVEALSRGTREQLFLSLRLALASSYARRGAAAAGARRRARELRRRSGEGCCRRVARLRCRRPPTAGVHLPRTHLEAVQVAKGAR